MFVFMTLVEVAKLSLGIFLSNLRLFPILLIIVLLPQGYNLV